jgi:4-hydroxyphenylpyruvate dioxygenase
MPDGTDLFFCRTPEPRNWLADFEPVKPGPSAAGPAGLLTAIDHVALSPGADHFDETLLAYPATFGLKVRSVEEFADPYGLLRSRALTSDGFNLIFNVPVIGGDDPERSGVQHIAFGCTDIFAVAAAFRANHVPLLPIPQNYYDDLAARTDLPAATVARMQEHGILYDRSSSGQFYQLYTASLSRNLFFEVVQRVGDYDGFGAPNAPVRRAMQSPLYLATIPELEAHPVP